jgi:hypothetical protein
MLVIKRAVRCGDPEQDGHWGAGCGKPTFQLTDLTACAERMMQHQQTLMNMRKGTVDMPPHPTRPRPHGMLSFAQWMDRYGYYVNCVFRNVEHHILHNCQYRFSVDWDRMHDGLAHYMYRTSSNHYRNEGLLK